MKYRGTTVVWLVAIMLVVGLATTTSAATISLVPSENAPERGETITLDIVIDVRVILNFSMLICHARDRKFFVESMK